MFNWDELTNVYDAMLRNCQHAADAHTRELADNAEGMLSLIRSLRSMPHLEQVNLWISQDALVINPPNSGEQIRVWYEPDSSYLIQTYSPTTQHTAELRAESEQVVAQIEQYLKRN